MYMIAGQQSGTTLQKASERMAAPDNVCRLLHGLSFLLPAAAASCKAQHLRVSVANAEQGWRFATQRQLFSTTGKISPSEQLEVSLHMATLSDSIHSNIC